jgi:hypothetical protein
MFILATVHHLYGSVLLTEQQNLTEDLLRYALYINTIY